MMSEQPTPPSEEVAPRPPRPGGGLAFPLILIVAGLVLLLNTTGVLPWSVWERIWPLWPVVLILIGVDLLFGQRWRALRLVLGLIILVGLIVAGFYLVTTTTTEERARAQTQSWLLESARRGIVVLEIGAGELDIGTTEDTNILAQVQLEGPEGTHFEHTFDDSGDRAYLEINGPESSSPWPFRSRPDLDIYWRVDLNPRIPLQLDVATGAGKSQLDLYNLQVDDLEMSTGAGEVEITLPAQVEQGQVHVQLGVGRVTVIIPRQVAARIEIDAALVSVSVDETRFPKTDGAYQSPDYGRAAYRLDVEISGAVGEIQVRSD